MPNAKSQNEGLRVIYLKIFKRICQAYSTIPQSRNSCRGNRDIKITVGVEFTLINRRIMEDQGGAAKLLDRQKIRLIFN